MTAETWLERWAVVEYRALDCADAWASRDVLTPSGVLRAKATLESAAQEFWAIRDWMRNSATSPVSVQDWQAFERSPQAYHLRACGDLATWVKHAAVSHEVRHVLALEYSGEYIDGDAIPFRAIRVYFEPRTKQEQKDNVVRVPSAKVDNYPDASEMIRRAFRELTTFIAPYLPTL